MVHLFTLLHHNSHFQKVSAELVHVSWAILKTVSTTEQRVLQLPAGRVWDGPNILELGDGTVLVELSLVWREGKNMYESWLSFLQIFPLEPLRMTSTKLHCHQETP